MLSAALLHLLPSASPPHPAVGAIYFGDWHVDVQHAELHGPNWTEFTLPIHATPRFPGHLQPNIPLSAPGFGMELENAEDKPAAMSKTTTETAKSEPRNARAGPLRRQLEGAAHPERTRPALRDPAPAPQHCRYERI